MDQTILEWAAEHIAGEWLEQGAERRELRNSEDLYPADYEFAADQLGRVLATEERRDLRAMVSGWLSGETTERSR